MFSDIEKSDRTEFKNDHIRIFVLNLQRRIIKLIYRYELLYKGLLSNENKNSQLCFRISLCPKLG
jgi:hypothetical protein